MSFGGYNMGMFKKEAKYMIFILLLPILLGFIAYILFEFGILKIP